MHCVIDPWIIVTHAYGMVRGRCVNVRGRGVAVRG